MSKPEPFTVETHLTAANGFPHTGLVDIVRSDGTRTLHKLLARDGGTLTVQEVPARPIRDFLSRIRWKAVRLHYKLLNALDRAHKA